MTDLILPRRKISMFDWLFGVTKEERRKWKRLRVALVFLARPDKPVTSGVIYNATGLMLGAIYPLLLEMEREEWLDSEFEAGERPRRRFYWLTKLGKAEAMRLLEEGDSRDPRTEEQHG